MADTDIELPDSQTLEQETPPDNVFIPPSIHTADLLSGKSYTHFSPTPSIVINDPSTPISLGIDEAGRGPVLGPMVYGLFYLPTPLSTPLLKTTHHFDDSKVLTPSVRSSLMRQICTPGSDLHESCGWAVSVLSARDIAAGMMAPTGYNLNAQAVDATIALVKRVIEGEKVNVREVFVDTIGDPRVYQRRLERVFPGVGVRVEKKADSLFPVVSAASVVAKVTRDAALEGLWEGVEGMDGEGKEQDNWGSGYPSDARTSTWLKRNMDPLFGWGNECRFSWGTAKELLEAKGAKVKVDWPVEDEEDGMKMTDFFSMTAGEDDEQVDELAGWYGRKVDEMVF